MSGLHEWSTCVVSMSGQHEWSTYVLRMELFNLRRALARLTLRVRLTSVAKICKANPGMRSILWPIHEFPKGILDSKNRGVNVNVLCTRHMVSMWLTYVLFSLGVDTCAKIYYSHHSLRDMSNSVGRKTFLHSGLEHMKMISF